MKMPKLFRSRLRRVASRAFDVAFTYRMGAGAVGSVTRTHPVAVKAYQGNASTPPTAFGQPVIFDGSNGIRPLASGDTTVTELAGITVRPYPFQAATQDGNYGQANFGPGAPASNQPIDIEEQGYILVQLNTSAGTPTIGAAVFVWVAATTAGHVQGQFETGASGGNTAALDTTRYQFASAPDANGVVELRNNV